MPTYRNRRFLWLTMLLLLITCPTIILILRLADVDMIHVARTGAEHTANSLTYRLCDRQTSFPADTHFQNGPCSVIERQWHSQENNAEIVGARNQAKGTEGVVENTRHGVLIAVLSLAAFLVLLGFLAIYDQTSTCIRSCQESWRNPEIGRRHCMVLRLGERSLFSRVRTEEWSAVEGPRCLKS